MDGWLGRHVSRGCDQVLFLHTAVDDALKGRGLAHRLVWSSYW